MKFATAAAAAAVIVVALSGCTAASSAGTGTRSPAPIPEAVTSQAPVPVATNPASLQQQLVTTLKSICSQLSDYDSDPANWQLTANNNGSAPFELATDDGDGGTVILDVTPGMPLAEVSVSPANYDTTNALLAYSGCSTITTMPPAPPAPKMTVYVKMPNLVGHTRNEFVDWENRSGTGFTNLAITFQGPNHQSGCEGSGENIITRQSIAPGTWVPQGWSSNGFRIYVYCP